VPPSLATSRAFRRSVLLPTLLWTSAGCSSGDRGAPPPGCITSCSPPCLGYCPPPSEYDAGTTDDATVTYPMFGWVPFYMDGSADENLDESSSTDGMPNSDAACTPLATPVHCVQGHCVDEPPIACVDGGWFCLTGSAACYDDGGAAD
jgi:hypothetical protein